MTSVVPGTKGNRVKVGITVATGVAEMVGKGVGEAAGIPGVAIMIGVKPHPGTKVWVGVGDRVEVKVMVGVGVWVTGMGLKR